MSLLAQLRTGSRSWWRGMPVFQWPLECPVADRVPAALMFASEAVACCWAASAKAWSTGSAVYEAQTKCFFGCNTCGALLQV